MWFSCFITLSIKNSSQFWLLCGAISPSHLQAPNLSSSFGPRHNIWAVRTSAVCAMVQQLGNALLCSPTKQPEEPAPLAPANNTASMPGCDIGLCSKKSSRQPCNIMPQDPVPQLIEVHHKDQTKTLQELDTVSASI